MAEQQQRQQFPQFIPKKDMFLEPLPYSQRTCTDRICMIIGLIFAIGVALYSFLNISLINQNRLSVPSDSDGKMCGIDYPNYPYIYFTNPPDISKRVCVKQCPKSGDSELQCVATTGIGCQFTDIPNFTVKYYETERVQDSNGNFCMPSDQALQQKIMENGNLNKRLIFFKNYDVFITCVLIAIGVSLLHIILVHFFTYIMVWFTIIASIIVLIALAIIMFLYKTQSSAKLILAVFLAVFSLIYLINIIIHRRETDFGSIFLHQSVRFTGKNPSTFSYIFIFFGLTVLFLWSMMKEYSGFVSSRQVNFNAQESLYYETSISGLGLAWVVLGFQLLWGLLFLKQAFKFLLSYHAVRYDLKKGGGLCAIPEAWKLLILKHLGSVIGGSFITLLEFIPDLIIDLFRKTYTSENGCCGPFDLVRTDALALVSLSGMPYCNSAKYCEYLTYESITSNSNQSVLKIYRIAAHLLIAGTVSILGLYIKGTIDPYTIGFTILIGIFISTYLISYQADPAEAFLLMYLLDEEYWRRQQQQKVSSIPSNIIHQNKYVGWLTKIYAQKPNKNELANQIYKLKKLEWAEQNKEEDS